MRLSLAILVLLGGFALRVWNLNAESIWHDEGWSIRAIRGPFTTPDDNTPYVYYAANHLLWKLGTGETPFALRYGSVMIGVVTIAIAIRLAWQWYGFGAGLTTGILVGSSPLLWEYAQEVRAYIAVPLIGLLLIGCIDSILAYSPRQSIPRQLWVMLFGTELVGIYTHNLVIPMIVWGSVAVGVIWLWQHEWQRLWAWFGLHIALILCYLPWLFTQSPSGTPLNTPPQLKLMLIKDIWYSYFLPVLAQLQNTQDDVFLNVGGILVIMLGIALLWVEKSVRGWILVSHAVLVPIFSTLLLLAAHIDFHPRYYIAAVPGTLLLAVAGANTLKKLDMRLMGFGLIAVSGIWISRDSLNAITTTRIYQHDDFAGLADYYASLPEDAVILIPFDDEPALQDYFANHKNIQAQLVNIPLYSSEDEVIKQLAQLVENGERHVEFLTWFQLPADVRGMFPCLLSANSREIGEVQNYFGLSTQAYTLTSASSFTPLEASPNYELVQLENAGWMASEQGICVRTTWSLTKQVDFDWSVALHVLNEYGWSLDQTDEVMRDDEQVETHQWEINDRGDTYHLLHLPAAAPRGNYWLEWTVYNEHVFPSGIDVLSGAGASLGKDFRPMTPITATGSLLENPPDESQLLSDNFDSTQVLEVTLLLVDETTSVSLVGNGWEVRHPVTWQNRPQLSWHIFRIPYDASGEAQLLVNDTLMVSTYNITKVDRQFTKPESEITLMVGFENIGNLVGVTLSDTMISPNKSLQVTLIWEAAHPTEQPYTVFVQLLDENGRKIAQSDKQPAENQRPTTGWVANEYIVDNHTLDLEVNNYRGTATVIVGFYDPNTFERVLTLEGSDHTTLPVDIIIE